MEELLIANWTKFLDRSKFMAFTLQTVRDRINSFAILSDSEVKHKGTQITVSRFHIVPEGFILWAEFAVPIDNNTAVGTCELYLSNKGELSHISTLGNLYCRSDHV